MKSTKIKSTRNTARLQRGIPSTMTCLHHLQWRCVVEMCWYLRYLLPTTTHHTTRASNCRLAPLPFSVPPSTDCLAACISLALASMQQNTSCLGKPRINAVPYHRKASADLPPRVPPSSCRATRGFGGEDEQAQLGSHAMRQLHCLPSYPHIRLLCCSVAGS